MARLSEVRIGDCWRVRVRGEFRTVEVIETVSDTKHSGRFNERTVTMLRLKNVKTGKPYPKLRTAAFLRTWISGLGMCGGCGQNGRVSRIPNRPSVLCADKARREDCLSKLKDRLERERLNACARIGYDPLNPDAQKEHDMKKSEVIDAILAINPDLELDSKATKADLEKILADQQEAKEASDKAVRLTELGAMKKGDLVKLAAPFLQGEKMRQVRGRAKEELIQIVFAGEQALTAPVDAAAEEQPGWQPYDEEDEAVSADLDRRAAEAKAKAEREQEAAAEDAKTGKAGKAKKNKGSRGGGSWDTRNGSAQKNIERWTRRVSVEDAAHLAHAYKLIAEGDRAGGRSYLLEQKMLPPGTTTSAEE